LVAAIVLQTTKPQILALLERILLGEILGVLRVLAVNADLQFNRQVAKDAKKTPSETIWLRLRRTRFIREIRGQ
jgi:hypothetical protein